MSNDPFEGRQVPGIDAVDIGDILAQGPSVPRSEVSPSAQPIVPGVVAPNEPTEEVVQEEPPAREMPQAPQEGEGPSPDAMQEMVLPTDGEKQRLKAQFGTLRVVPIPYTRGDGKIQCYVLRQLTRQHWRSMEQSATDLAEKKGGGLNPEEIFQEKIVAHAVVWPEFEEHHVKLSPAGLVPTLFGVVQQMGLFFNPDAIMQVTFPL